MGALPSQPVPPAVCSTDRHTKDYVSFSHLPQWSTLCFTGWVSKVTLVTKVTLSWEAR